ncbi:MAG: CopG family transcriptional regulator [Geobacteraceae bacterium]|nr:MAG: CopG family transcriptional regulator [Geobacteraceae bacterium]
MARPLKENGRLKGINVRVDDTTYNAILQYMDKEGVPKSDAIRDLINMGMLHYVISTLPEE